MIIVSIILYPFYVAYIYFNHYKVKAMAKLSQFKQDVSKSEEGVKVDLGDGLQVTVARIGNKKYQDFIRKATKPYQQAIRNKTLSDSIYEKIMVEAMADSILLGWEGMEDDHGDLIPYSKDMALEILSDPAYADFKQLVNDLANEQETFRSEALQETVGK